MKNMQKKELLHYLQHTATKVDRAMAEDIGDGGTAGVQVPLLQQILDHALLSGGKRVRPVLCVAAAALCGRTDSAVFLFAAALEYLHGASLLHDDIIDGALQRRGKTATHSRFGATPAILAGDFLHARAMDLAGSLGHSCLAAFSRAISAMIHGEFIQMTHIGNPYVTEETYYSIITGKTAALLESACEAGALYAKATTEKKEALKTYGRELGLAFQMIDDLLDYLGDPAVTGKPQGTDLGEGKATLPLIHAMQTADAEGQAHLVRLFTASGKTPGHIKQASKIIDKCNGFHYTREKAAEHGKKALEALAAFDSMSDEIHFLSGMVRYVLERHE